MTILFGVVGVVVGFTIGVVFTEVVFANSSSWPDVVPFALAVLGWLVGSTTAERRRVRRDGAPDPSAPSPR